MIAPSAHIGALRGGMRGAQAVDPLKPTKVNRQVLLI